MKKSIRQPPAYQEYAASMLAKPEFRLMDLEARGLFYTLRLECWANLRVFADIDGLASMLNLETHRIERSIEAMYHFFEKEGGFLYCPELDAYRSELERRRLRQSSGGKKGAATTNSKRFPEGSGGDIGAVYELPAGRPRLSSIE